MVAGDPFDIEFRAAWDRYGHNMKLVLCDKIALPLLKGILDFFFGIFSPNSVSH